MLACSVAGKCWEACLEIICALLQFLLPYGYACQLLPQKDPVVGMHHLSSNKCCCICVTGLFIRSVTGCLAQLIVHGTNLSNCMTSPKPCCTSQTYKIYRLAPECFRGGQLLRGPGDMAFQQSCNSMHGICGRQRNAVAPMQVEGLEHGLRELSCVGVLIQLGLQLVVHLELHLSCTGSHSLGKQYVCSCGRWQSAVEPYA